MQFRRTQSIFVTLLLGLTGAASLLAIPAALRADMVMKPPPLVEKEMRTRAAKADLRTSSHGVDADTVWIGHIADATTAERVALSAHGIPAAGYGPFHIGRGPNRIVGGRLGTNAAYNGVWDFDHLQAGEADSLMGWWPFCFPFQSVGPSNLPDVSRPWFCLDYGNQANYVIPQGSPKRTFGVVGIWHRDPGNTSNVLSPSNCTGVTGNAAVTCPFGPDVEWAPIGGTCSAWCGLRALHDNTVKDAVTGNAFNQSVVEYQGINNGTQTGSLSTGGTDSNFPGYGSQWDQSMYRDIDFASTATGLYVKYSYRTNMDTRKSGVFNSQAGWFSFDPHGSAASPASINGMPAFISANNPTTTPTDSFMVYIGKPVEPVAGTPPNDFTGGDNALHELYDAVRPADPYNRWFSEVIDITSDKQLQSSAGVGSGIGVNTVISGATLTNASVDIGGGLRRTRLVFRVKTNRAFDDEDAFNSKFSSHTEGAALVDDVEARENSSSGTIRMTENFEDAGAVDNTQPASAKWRSTGKPPQPYFHLHDFAALGISDPCGAATAAIRFCNSYGKCASPGDHDNGDKPGGGKTGVPNIRFNKSDAEKGFMSPTINLMSTGTGDYNQMGIDAAIAGRRIVFQGDQTYNVYNFPVTGNGFRYFMQAYPALQPNRNKVWGQMRKTSFFNFITTRGCFETVIGVPAEDQLIRFSGATVSTHPDSFRVGIEAMARCYTLNLSDAACSPASGVNSGGPYDNLTVGLATAPAPPEVAIVIWDLYNDAFTTNPSNQISTSILPNGFDTTTAYVRTGRNNSPNTGIAPGGANARHNVPADTCIAEAPSTNGNARLDLVFRILPGVGNYVSIGNRTSGLSRVVTASGGTRTAAGNLVTSGDTTFWGQYMADNGTYGTAGGHAGNGGALSGWDANVWNSAQCDTLESNLFPRTSFDGNLAGLAEGFYASMYHESDPKFAKLGIRKNRCFLQDKLTGNGETQITEKYIRCAVATAPGFQGNDGTWPPDPYLNNAGSGLAAAGGEIAASGPASATVRAYPASARGETFEFTQILPDGLFTPGTHVEYWFRKSVIGNTTAFAMGPDTNYVFPQPSIGTFDYKRWQEFSILPDRWKDNQFAAGGQGPACMLVVDNGDRRGDEPVWVSVADTIGLTSVARRGAHNGWSAAQGVTVEGNVGTNNAVCVRPHGGSAGTVWDFYQVIAGESNVSSAHLGSRYANESNPGVEAGKFSRLGPTQAVLLDTYKTLVWLNADMAEESVGPFTDGTDDDVFLLNSFASVASPDFDNRPRGLVMYGTDLRGGAAGTSTDLVNFFNNTMEAGLAFDDYRQNGGVTNDVSKLSTTAFNIVGATPMPSGEVSVLGGGTGPTYGVYNPCFIKLDVFTPNSPGVMAARYENIGATTAAPAAVYANEDGSRDARTYLGGWTYGFFGGMGTAPNYQNGQLISALLPYGTQRYTEGLLTNIFGSFNCKPSGSPVGVGQDPGSHGSAFVNFLNLRSDNPMRSGEARIAFGIAKTEKVEIKVYDVSGRLVKTLANRIFPGGLEHVVIWDGTNDGGSKVARGVYFYQLRSPSFVSQKKLAVLKN